MQESWHKYMTEAFATFIIVFVAAGATLANSLTGGLGVVGIALASGLALLAMFYSAYHLSGAHFNPAVTVALWATGHIKTVVGAGYIISQLVGAVVAALFLRVAFSTASPAFHVGAVSVGPGVTPGVAIFIEAILTFILVYTYFATVIDKKEHGSHAGLALGLIWTATILVGWNLTGAALNPARSFGPALVANYWTMHYVYWVGPLIGALIAGYAYHFGYLKKKAG